MKVTSCTLTSNLLCARVTHSSVRSIALIARGRRPRYQTAATAIMKAKVVRARISVCLPPPTPPPPPHRHPSQPCKAASIAKPHSPLRGQAVIGAGAAGLVAARELIREGHCVKVFEQVPHGALSI